MPQQSVAAALGLLVSHSYRALRNTTIIHCMCRSMGLIAKSRSYPLLLSAIGLKAEENLYGAS